MSLFKISTFILLLRSYGGSDLPHFCRTYQIKKNLSLKKNQFESFTKNLELNLDTNVANNSYFVLVLSGISERTKIWYEFGKSMYKGIFIVGVRSQFGFEQLTQQSRHVKWQNVVFHWLNFPGATHFGEGNRYSLLSSWKQL